MAAVLGLNGQGENFALLNNTPTKDSDPAEVVLRVNRLLSSNETCNLARTCPLVDNGSSKLTDDVTPKPGYVIKASASGGGIKVFVNVCKKESIEKPSPAKQLARGERFGLSWTIPHALTEQVVNSTQHKQAYRVFDFQVHPDTCRMAETNSSFKSMLNELAIGAVAEEYNVSVNVRKLRFPKMKYRGVQLGTLKNDTSVLQGSSVAMAEILHNEKVAECCKQQNVKLSVDSSNSEIPDQKKTKSHTVIDVGADIDDNNNKFTVPKYTVTCLSNEEMSVVNRATFSQMLVVNIELPLVSSALAIKLDVFEKCLNLTSSGAIRYKLEIDLPCVVDENHSFAKFVKSRKVLCVTMPVLSSSSSSVCASSSESRSSADPGDMLVTKGDVNTEFISTDSFGSLAIASGQEADLSMPTRREWTFDESLNCLSDMQLSYTQDVESVSFIFKINSVVPSSVSVTFISDTFCRIEMDKVIGDGILSHICCLFKFHDDCKCKDDAYTVDAMDNSVVLVVAKASESHHTWNTFWTGPDINHLEEKQFSTSACLTSNCELLDVEPCEKDKSASTLQVHSEDVETSRNSDEDTSSEIVVVHEKGVPKLHGILKQRSVSESSDDGVRAFWTGNDRQVSTTTGSEDDDNEDSPDRSAASLSSSSTRVVRKSVSFNDRIDRTLFQANQSVSSMHAALKNRRRRARKRDQKQEQREQRRRRRSSGSFSLEESGDEQAAGVHDACVHAEKAGENYNASQESSEYADECRKFADVTRDRVDGSFHNNVASAEIANEKVLSSQDVLDSESSIRNRHMHENEKPENTLLKSKLALSEIQNENVNYSDAFRTKNCLEDCGSENVSDAVCNVPKVCDMSSVHLFGDGDDACDASDIDMMCSGSGAVGSFSQPVVSCNSSAELVKLSHTADDSMSVAGPESQLLAKIAISLTSSVLDLDVD